MKTYLINEKYLICAENEIIAKNLAECKNFGEVFSVEFYAQ